MTDCAAFSLEAIENGEKSECMAATLESLEQALAANRERQLVLEQQMSFLTRTRADLPSVLRFDTE